MLYQAEYLHSSCSSVIQEPCVSICGFMVHDSSENLGAYVGNKVLTRGQQGSYAVREIQRPVSSWHSWGAQGKQDLISKIIHVHIDLKQNYHSAYSSYIHVNACKQRTPICTCCA